MSSQNPINQKDNIIHFPVINTLLDYCPSAPDTKHTLVEIESDPETELCLWCGLLLTPDTHPERGG